MLVTSCGLLPKQSNRSDITGDNASVVQHYVSGMSSEQLIALMIVTLGLGFALNIALRYAIKRYGIILGLIYYGAGLVLVSLLTWLVI